MTFSRRPTKPAVYAKLAAVLVVLSFFVCGAGCSRKREVTGQVFVVNAGGQNIRLGLVGIHVVGREQLISATEQAVTNSSGFFRNLDITATGSGAESFWSGLPSPVGLTDAAGEFRVSILEADLILARTSVLMGSESKQFIWVIPAKNLGGPPVLLSNHNLFEGGEASMALISSLPGIVEVAKLRRVAEQSTEKERELSEIRSKSDRAARSSAQAGKQAAEIVAGKHPLVDKTFGRLVVVSNAWAEALIFAQNAAASAAEANAPLVVSAAEVAKAEAAAALQVAKTSAQDAESAQNSITAKKHHEVAVNAASKAKTASGKAFDAANLAEGFSQDIAKAVQPPERRLETIGRFAASAKDSANEAAEASRQAEIYAQAAQKSVALKESLESAIEAALAAVDARIRSQRASTLASNELNSARATEALSAAKAASFAASQAESSLDQVNRALQRSMELTSADLPKLVRKAGDSKNLADQGAKEASRILVAFEAAASAVPELMTRLSTNTASRGMLEIGTNTVTAIRQNLKEGQAIVVKIVEAVEASARGRQNTDEAFISSLIPLANELADSVETNATTAKGLADSLSITNLALADADKILDRVESIRQMVEIESIAIGRINSQFKNISAISSGPRVEKALILARNANVNAAEHLVEILFKSAQSIINNIKLKAVGGAIQSTNIAGAIVFAEEQQQCFESIKSVWINADERLRLSNCPDINKSTLRFALISDEAAASVFKANVIVLNLIERRLAEAVEESSIEWSKIDKETSRRSLSDSRGRLETILSEQENISKIVEAHPDGKDLQNHTREMHRSVTVKINGLIGVITKKIQEIELAESDKISKIRKSIEDARFEAGRASVIGLHVHWIPPGAFNMGSPDSESGRESDEIQHNVVLDKGFFMSETECTQEQLEMVMEDNPSTQKGADKPVENISWDDAVEFCKKLTDRQRREGLLPEGWAWRLPTEAEWEYAARAGNVGGSNGDLLSEAWYTANALGSTHVVKSKRANKWGLYDMLGNVWEWCSDWYGDYPRTTVVDPLGPKTGHFRVVRGSSFNDSASLTRFAYRMRNPVSGSPSVGFRPVLSEIR